MKEGEGAKITFTMKKAFFLMSIILVWVIAAITSPINNDGSVIQQAYAASSANDLALAAGLSLTHIVSVGDLVISGSGSLGTSIPTEEICDDGIDNNNNGPIDEGCAT